MPRILYVHHTSRIGGAENSLLELVRGLGEGFEAVVACPGDGPLVARLRVLGARVEPVPIFRFKRTASPLRLARYGLAWRRGGAAICRIIADAQIDLVHSNSTTAHLYASVAARRAGIPCVWHVRDVTIPGVGSSIAVPRLFKTSACVAVSKFIAGHLKSAAGIDAEVIYNGVDMERFHPVEHAPGTPTVTMVAQMVPWKGQRDFLQAAAIVRKSIPSAIFQVVGTDLFGDHPDYRSFLDTLATKLEIDTAVTFAGQRDDVPDLLRASTLLVQPSRDEPFGRAVIEAMASGLPVVAYNEGGPAEIIVHGETGLLVAPGDVQALGDAIMKLLAAPRAAAKLGRAGRARAAAMFDSRQTARAVTALYSRLLKGNA